MAYVVIVALCILTAVISFILDPNKLDGLGDEKRLETGCLALVSVILMLWVAVIMVIAYLL